MRRELEVPLQLARISVQRDHGTRVEVVSRAHLGVPVGPCIPNAPIRQVQRRVIRTGQPDRPATMLPRIAAPRLVARFARLGDGLDLRCHSSSQS